MKKLLFILAAISLSHLVVGQTPNENYVKTTSYQVKTQNGNTNATTSQNLTDDEKIESITYFDGLGRLVQSIAKQAGGNKEHIITPIEYDVLGRQAKDYLPFAYSANNGTSLNYVTPLDLLEDLESYYLNKYPEDQITSSSINAYSEKVFESSPLNRVLEQGAPGNDWLANPLSDADHTIKFGYQTNGSNEVRYFKVSHPNNDTEQAILEYEGYYDANELYKTVTKDENWQPNANPNIKVKKHTTEEFKDTQGRVILKRIFNDAEVQHDTYYVYDDYGNLTYVLSPEGSDTILDGSDNVQPTILDKLCYQYRYDHRNRLVEKKIPGKGWEYIVYNKLDQPILTQDANLDAQNLWLFTKYDAFGRVAYTGTMSSSSSRATLQTSVNGLAHKNATRTSSTTNIAGTVVYYDNQAYPTVNIQQLLTINYYDDYNWDTGNSFEASYTMNLSSGLTKTGNQIEKTSATGWDAGFKSQATISGDGYVQWTVTQTDKAVMVGLSKTNSAPDNHYNTIDYALYTGADTMSRVYIYEEGVGKSIPATYYAVGDVFKVERVGDQILYKKNDVVFYSSMTPSTGTLLADSAFNHIGTIIEDVFIGYSVMGQAFSSNTKSLATGSKVRVLDTNNWITSLNYYDDKGRPIHSTSVNNYLNTEDATSSLMDFTGKVLKTHSTHTISFGGKKTNPIVTMDRFIYDHAARLLRQVQSINSGAEQLIAKNNYDELGQLTQKKVGGTLPQWSTYVNYAPYVSTTNNIITKISGNDIWAEAGGVSTQENIQGDGYLSFKVSQIWNSFMAGLSYTDTNNNYTSINYAIYIIAGGKVNVYESGSNKGEKTSYVPGDVFSVERRGTSIYYLKNGEAFYASLIPTTSASMVGDVSILHINTIIKDLALVNLENTLQDVDYAYNIRGWLKTINNPSSLGNDLFGFQIGYNNPTVSGATPLFNGNISETLWKTDNIDNSLKSYKYTYDALNRITTGIDNLDRYSLGSGSPVSYDKNGNIMGLYRKGHTNEDATTFGVMDNLAYVYDGNQLLHVSDSGNTAYGFNDGNTSGNDYVYDANGNMTVDNNKGLTLITYNHLNLPTDIYTSGIIKYVYDATGVKQKKQVIIGGSSTTNTYYAGNHIYEGLEGQPGFLKFFNHPEGYIETDGSGNFDYIYQYKDHLGNIRLSYKDISTTSTPLLEIIEENNYYPFGLKHKGYNNVINGTDHPYGFGGKEEQDELGLGWIDITARNYDPALGRWMNPDPLAENSRRWTPYNYAYNNPIFFIDPDGMQAIDPVKKNISSSSQGNVSPVNVNNISKCLVCGPKTEISPSSNSSGSGRTVEYSKMQDEQSFIQIFATEGGTAELTHSVSLNETNITSQYYDSEGITVGNVKDASSMKVTTETINTKIDMDIDNISDKATVTKTSSSATYDVSRKPNSDLQRGYVLSNERITPGKPTISTINTDKADAKLQNYAKQEAKANFIGVATDVINTTRSIQESQSRNFEESVKKL